MPAWPGDQSSKSGLEPHEIWMDRHHAIAIGQGLCPPYLLLNLKLHISSTAAPQRCDIKPRRNCQQRIPAESKLPTKNAPPTGTATEALSTKGSQNPPAINP